MKVHIIGCKGVVGSATSGVFRRYGHEVVGTDLGDDPTAVNADYHVVCVPEGAVPGVVRDLVRGDRVLRGREVPIVVRSSVPPGTCQRLASEYRWPIFHNPEFLREAMAEPDVASTQTVVVGYTAPWTAGKAWMMQDLYDVMPGVQYHWLHSDLTELLKLSINTYLATQIAFWESVGQIAELLGVNAHQLSRAAAVIDPRVSEYGAYYHGRFGGHCLPKDLQQLITAAEQVGLDAVVLRSVQAFNNALLSPEPLRANPAAIETDGSGGAS